MTKWILLAIAAYLVWRWAGSPGFTSAGQARTVRWGAGAARVTPSGARSYAEGMANARTAWELYAQRRSAQQ